MTIRSLAPILALAVAVPLITSACAPADPAASAAADDARTPAVTVLGPGQSCINRSQLRSTVVRTDRVIDFEMSGGKVYRSTLKNRCPGLGWDRAITYENAIDQLCTQQIVYSLQNIGGVIQRGAGCSLGEFVPVEYVEE
jgi:hypothetical protein